MADDSVTVFPYFSCTVYFGDARMIDAGGYSFAELRRNLVERARLEESRAAATVATLRELLEAES
jgi:hypothetical protein